MGVGRADAVGRIERDPAETGHEGLGPGMAGVLIGHAVVAAKVAAHITGGDAGAAGSSEKDMGEVLAYAALERVRLSRRRCGVGRIGIELNITMQSLEQQ